MEKNRIQELRILVKKAVLEKLRNAKQSGFIGGKKMVDSALLNLIKRQFKLDLSSRHGINHWDRVAQIGAHLSEHTKADPEVVNLFAYLHDSQRREEGDDPEHGVRASIFVKELYDKGFLDISADQLKNLILACKYHNYSDVESNDVTIQTCWDADRLDLGRVGIKPDERFLNTAFAKQMSRGLN